MEKFRDAHSHVQHAVDVRAPLHLARCELERVHQPTYLDVVGYDSDTSPTGAGLTRYQRNRLGLPADARLLARSTLETAGTVAATLAALDVGMAANLAGGTHHAFPDRGLGFCVLNDVAVAIEYVRAHGIAPDQILIIDTDAHQGNANHAFFRADQSVFTYSIHVGKNYPAAKEPGDQDIPLPRYVSGEAYLAALRSTLPAALAQTEPDLIFWISGADVHADDRFGQMSLSDEHIAARDHYVLAQCRNYAAKLVTLYGGGYNRLPGKTGWLHAQTILRVAEAFGKDFLV